MIVAVVLAAGESRRMGRPKALLPIAGKSFIETIVTALRQTRIGEILVVLGHHAADLKPRIEALPITILINSEYRLGQLSSLQVAIRHLRGLPDLGRVDGILVHLVDHPYLNPALVDRMIESFYTSRKLIVLPRYQSRRGHPVIFATQLFGELLQAPLEQGAKAVVNAHRGDTLELETDDAGIAIDIDTPEEYRQHVKEE
ncbi:MAG: nucleotidyltransferase family protein [Alphaproteobacteria bacterium]